MHFFWTSSLGRASGFVLSQPRALRPVLRHQLRAASATSFAAKKPSKKARAEGILARGEGPFAYHEEVTLRIDDLSNLGAGVGRVDLGPSANASFNGGQPSKYVVMVPGSMPGDLVKARVWQNRKTHSVADLVEVLQPSPGRIEPACPYFGSCGGCQYQFMSISDQRTWKRGHVAGVLERIGGFPKSVAVAPVVGSDEAFGYRSKLTPHHGPPDAEGNVGPIGFQRAGTRALVDVERCLIAMPAVNARLFELRGEVRAKVKATAVAAAAAAVSTIAGGAVAPRGAGFTAEVTGGNVGDGSGSGGREEGGEEAALPATDFEKQAGRRRGGTKGAKGATLLLRHARDGVEVDPNASVVEDLAGETFRLSFRFKAGEFFQVRVVRSERAS